ncbi:TldD/PmbA family protein [Methanothermobacter tenebrarum]|uniref:TldD/PmbA family protein n=1 Tax=Methanothermobacter tenebrarum TaxID=680118 RepID=A0A328PHE5_9EURY|nr:TldD/PmbA family protein [Methanothermobacter tenebrarum]NPV65068.1 TldD/PmbA family protein [Methanobacteriaceae archaeon]RAO79255.1 TldD/PmbA family protein [Methanothermobacter tenebrarum]
MYDIAEKTFKEALKHAPNVEVYVQKEETLEVDIQRDKIDLAKEQHLTGLGLRVIQDKKMGFAYTTDMRRIKETIKMAVSNMGANEADENFKFSKPSHYPQVKKIYDKRFHDLEVSDAHEFAERMIDKVFDEGCEPTSGGFTASHLETLLLNSNGVESEYKSTGFSAHISVNAKEGDLKSTAYESDASCLMSIEPEKISQTACKIAKDSIGGEKIDTGDLSILLDYHAINGILATFTSAINADNVQRGRSYLADKIGEEIANLTMNIYDDGRITGGLYSAPMDDEGTPSQRTPIIEKGILKNFIYDLYTASKGNVKSTGNGIRPSFSSIPTVSTTNIILDFQDKITVDDIERGMLVTDVLGAHTANPISGDFSLEANNPFFIENGEIKYPIKKAMISGNLFNILKQVKMIDSKIRQIGAFITPRIFIETIRVIGG